MNFEISEHSILLFLGFVVVMAGLYILWDYLHDTRHTSHNPPVQAAATVAPWNEPGKMVHEGAPHDYDSGELYARRPVALPNNRRDLRVANQQGLH